MFAERKSVQMNDKQQQGNQDLNLARSSYLTRPGYLLLLVAATIFLIEIAIMIVLEGITFPS